VNTHLIITDGDLLDQPVEVIVNAWNRNFIPWWLLLPQGISGAIKRRGGYEPFRELSRKGVLPLGGAVVTGAGHLPFRAIIHVAGIGFLWRASEESIRKSVRNALAIAAQHGFKSVGFPLIGAGTGGARTERVEAIMEEEIRNSGFPGEVLLVRFKRGSEDAVSNRGPAASIDNSSAPGGPPSVS
jgi:O-acetyl-ADP-ribose deacetylase